MRKSRQVETEKTSAGSGRVIPVGVAVKRLQSALHLRLESGFAQYGLSLPQWDVLRSVREHPGASGAEIARECLVTPQTVNLILPRLVEAGFIIRKQAEQGRAIGTWLSETGKAALARCDQHAEAVENRLTSLLEVPEKAQLIDLLKRCSSALTGEREPKIAVN